jgi:DNA-binding transcriptional MocR family regulator
VHTTQDAQTLCRLASKNSVRVQPTEDGRVRLGFAGIPFGSIEAAVEALKDAWKDVWET